ncbi:benzyl alcohol O-benzoyltransferase isoform X1 [Arachis duranensis]|uniref:Benzyl alcohol O-benzoyltransferase isoform X1 n=1 Tax=Arachis duranensis TaxID=130453 RepID=A0A6P4DKW0_ARADU|nr:benzyl alcohol O-benzoyltransferase isoform X1 [Arachis duranensis]
MTSLSSSPSLVFTVRRRQPELVAPATPTPREVKLLSDIDDQEGLRFHIPFFHIYQHKPSMEGKDPVRIIRDALSRTLVFYYPFAGRIREGHGRKLMVDCTEEGVLFIEADADVTLDQLRGSLHPPFPCSQELLYNVPGSDGIVNCPLLLIQVTRFKCGGFIFAIRVNHTMVDGTGLVQFVSALTEMAQGAHQPSILPVWQRELLLARNPPQITCNHREYEQLPNTKEGTIISYDENDMVQRSFFFGPTEIAFLRRLVPRHLGQCTRFELITACLWRCRTKALQLAPEDDVRMMCIVNARARFNPNIPLGYYGNAFAYPAAVASVRKLCENPFGYAVELIKKVKAEVTEEYVRSVADLMVTKERPLFTTVGSCIVSNLTRFGLKEADFGWGKALYAGVSQGGAGPAFHGATFFMNYENEKGEKGVLFPIYLPSNAMERFEKELGDFLGGDFNNNQPTKSDEIPMFMRSTL